MNILCSKPNRFMCLVVDTFSEEMKNSIIVKEHYNERLNSVSCAELLINEKLQKHIIDRGVKFTIGVFNQTLVPMITSVGEVKIGMTEENSEFSNELLSNCIKVCRGNNEIVTTYCEVDEKSKVAIEYKNSLLKPKEEEEEEEKIRVSESIAQPGKIEGNKAEEITIEEPKIEEKKIEVKISESKHGKIEIGIYKDVICNFTGDFDENIIDSVKTKENKKEVSNAEVCISASELLVNKTLLEYIEFNGLKIEFNMSSFIFVKLLGHSDKFIIKELESEEVLLATKEYQKVMSSDMPYVMIKYIIDDPKIFSVVSKKNIELENLLTRETLKQKSPEDELSISLPYYSEVRSMDFKIPQLNYFSPLPKALSKDTFMKVIDRYNGDYRLEDVIGYEDADELPVPQKNEEKFFKALKYLVDESLKYEAEKQDKTVEELKEIGYKENNLSLFFFNFALFALEKNRAHINALYCFPRYKGEGDFEDEDDEDDENENKQARVESDGRVYFNADKKISLDSMDLGLILKDFVEYNPNPYAWCEAIVKLLRWGTRKPKCLLIESNENMLDLESFNVRNKRLRNLVPFIDEKGNNRFPVSIVWTSVHLGERSEISQKLPLTIADMHIVPIGLVCNDVYVSGDFRQENKKFIDMYTIIESFKQDNGVKIKGLSKDYISNEVKQMFQIDLDIIKKGGTPRDFLNTEMDFYRWKKAIVDKIIKTDTSILTRNILMDFKGIGSVEGPSLDVFQRSMIALSFIQRNDTRDEIIKLKNALGFKNKQELRDNIENFDDVSKMLQLKIMHEMKLYQLFGVWTTSNDIEDLIKISLETLDKERERELLSKSSSFDKIDVIEENEDKPELRPIVFNYKIYGYYGEIDGKKVMVRKIGNYRVAQNNNIDTKGFNEILKEFNKNQSTFKVNIEELKVIRAMLMDDIKKYNESLR